MTAKSKARQSKKQADKVDIEPNKMALAVVALAVTSLFLFALIATM